VQLRLLELKSIYLLREHHTKSIAERSYSLLRGRDFSIQISLPGVIPSNAQDFYEHFDHCVLQIVHQQETSEAINAVRLAEVEQDQAVHKTLRSNAFSTETTNTYSADEDEDNEDDDDFTLRSKPSRNSRNKCNPANGVQKSRGVTHSKGRCDPEYKYKGPQEAQRLPVFLGMPEFTNEDEETHYTCV